MHALLLWLLDRAASVLPTLGRTRERRAADRARALGLTLDESAKWGGHTDEELAALSRLGAEAILSDLFKAPRQSRRRRGELPLGDDDPRLDA